MIVKVQKHHCQRIKGITIYPPNKQFEQRANK